MALVGVMMVMLLLLTAALIGVVGAGNTSTGNMNAQSRNAVLQTQTRINAYGAQNMADSGVRAVMQWLNFQSSAPSNMSAFRPGTVSTFFNATANGNYDRLTIKKANGTTVEGTVDVRVFPFADNDTATTRSYIIESIGIYNGKQQIIRAVAAQDTFAKYAFFAENAPVNTFFSFGTTVFNGPVHINGRNMDSSSPTYNPLAKIQILWKDNGTASSNRLFRYDGDNSFTTSVAEAKVDYYRNVQTNKSNPSTTNDWNNVALRGASGVRYSAPLVEMPTQSSKQRDAALGTPAATIANGKGLTVPAISGTSTGGLYINGDVDTMVFSASGTVQTITMYQTEGSVQTRTTIVVDPSQNGGAGRIRVTKATTPANNLPISTGTWTTVGGNSDTVGTTNGVLYVAGNIGTQGLKPIGGISGTIANNTVSNGVITRQNNLSIVTDSDKNINVNGSLRYASGSGNPNVNSAVVGIVTNKIQLTEFDNTYAASKDDPLTLEDDNTRLGDVTMDATVFAFDTFNAVNYLTRNIQSFTLTGGYIVNTSGAFAGIDGSGKQWTGFKITRNYDSRLANRPPPYFPSTSNQYKLRSYQRVNSTL